MQIAVVGANYVGLTTAACLAEAGHDVACVDIDATRVRRLMSGEPSRYETELDDLIRSTVDHDRLKFTDDWTDALRGVAMVFICVDAQDEFGGVDLRPVSLSAQMIGRHLTGSLLVVVRSTVPVGTGELVSRVLRTQIKARDLRWVALVASNPDFSKEGSFVRDFNNPDRVIIGTDKGAGEALLAALYEPFVSDDPGKLIFMDRRSAELTKFASDAMLATRVTLMNEFARYCDEFGADIDQVRRGIGADARIGGRYLFAGPGFGGSAFLRVVETLLQTGEERGLNLSVLRSVCQVNREQRHLLAAKIRDHFGTLEGRRVAVWGLAYKPMTEDVCESPAKEIIRCLLDWGAEVVAHDPVATPNFRKSFGERQLLSYVDRAYDAVNGADALVLVTEWPEYLRPNWEKVARLMRSRAVFDFRNQYLWSSLVPKGFHYRAVGRPDSEHPPVRADLC